MDNINVLIVDDHALVREGIAALVNKIAGVEAVATGNGADAMHLIRQLQPDVVLLEIDLMAISGFEIVVRWPTNFPPCISCF